MPMDVRVTATAGEVHANPFVGPIDHTVAIRVDVSAMPAAYVDQYGYLKPGAPLQRAGVSADAVAPAFVFGCVAEATRIHTDNTTLAGVTKDVDVTVVPMGTVNRKLLEDNLGRVLTANELAAFNAAGSKIALLY